MENKSKYYIGDSIMKKKIPCEIYDRVCGYFRPVTQFNPGKKSEFKERKRYTQEEIFKSKKFKES
jgi:hypothetical protein